MNTPSIIKAGLVGPQPHPSFGVQNNVLTPSGSSRTSAGPARSASRAVPRRGPRASATFDAMGGPAYNDGDNEITGIHVSDGDPTVAGLLGATTPDPAIPVR